MVTAETSFNTLPDNVREAILALSKTYADAPDFMEYIEQVALSNAISQRAKKTKYSVSRRFKQAGALGLGFDLAKTGFSFLKDVVFPSQTDRSKSIEKYIPSIQTNQSKNIEKQTERVVDKPEPPRADKPQTFFGNLINQSKKIEKYSNRVSDQPEPSKKDKSQTFFDKPIKVLIDGITDEGYRDLMLKLPDIIKKGILDAQEKRKDRYTPADKKGSDVAQGGGFSILEFLGLRQLLGRGLVARVLGFFTGLTGIFTGIYAITTSDPWKGLSKIVAKGLLSVSGISKMVQSFVGNIITKLIDLPGKLFLSFSVGIEKIFGKVAGGKVFDIGVKFLESAIPKALKTGLVFLRKVPIIGTLLSIGVAIDRIRKGDYFGGFLDVLSGIAALFPGIGTGIALAIDGLNAFLDYKAGGIGPGKPSKLGIVSDWITGATKWISEKVKNIPYLSSLARAFEHMQKGEWLEGLKSLGHSIPFISEVLGFIGVEETTVEGEPVDTTNLEKSLSLFTDLKAWVQESIVNKLTGWISSLYDWSKNKLSDLASSIGSFFTGDTIEQPDPVKITLNNKQAPVKEENSQNQISNEKQTSLKEENSQNQISNVRTENDMQNEMLKIWQERADIWKDYTEKTGNPAIPISNEVTALNNQTLDQIAGNTEITNNNLKILGEAILKLAQVFNNKPSGGNNNFIVNGQQQQNFPSASEIAATNRDPIRAVRTQFMPQMA